MTSRENILKWCRGIINKNGSGGYTLNLNPVDYDMLTSNDFGMDGGIRTLYGVPVTTNTNTKPISELMKEVKESPFIGSLPTEKLGKWTKTC